MSWNVGRIILWFYIKNYGYLISLDDYNEIKIIDFEKITLWIIVAYPDISNVLVIRSSICLNFNEISFNDRNKLLLSFDNTSIIKMIKKSLSFIDIFPFNIYIKEKISINFFIEMLKGKISKKDKDFLSFFLDVLSKDTNNLIQSLNDVSWKFKHSEELFTKTIKNIYS